MMVTTTATMTEKTATKRNNQPQKWKPQMGSQGDTDGEAIATTTATTTGQSRSPPQGNMVRKQQREQQ